MIRQILERSATVLGVTFFVIIGFTTNLTASNVENEDANAKYATVHFWADIPEEHRFGHVSFKTDKSYISIRREGLSHFGNVTIVDGRFTFFLNSDTARLVQPNGWFNWLSSCALL